MAHETEDELYHLALAAHMLESTSDPVAWFDADPRLMPVPVAQWRRAILRDWWGKHIAIGLWITVKDT